MSSPDRVICIVQARMGSNRLPGKVLTDLGGRPMLGLLLDRLSHLDSGVVSEVVVATSDLPGDDPVAALCGERGVPVVRGSEQDVLGRFLLALQDHPADHVVRITGDCPLTDPEIVRDVVELHLERGADYTCNVLPRTFPKGLDVEVARAAALRTAAAEAVDRGEREHVMPFLYRHPERFVLANLRSGEDLGDLSWTVDTREDLEALRALVEGVGDPALAGWREVLTYAGPIGPPAAGELRLRPATADDAEDLLAWRNDQTSVRFARSGTTVDREDHQRWLARVLDDPGVELDVVEASGTPVGMVRVDVSDGQGLVSIAVDASRRGQGVGAAALRALTARAEAGVRVDRLLAEVHRDNISSRRLFEGVGFVAAGAQGDFLSFMWTSPRERRGKEEDRQ